jgi:hypothetical protein
MNEVHVDVEGLNDAYKLIDKLTEAGYSNQQDFTWEYKNHIREFSFDQPVVKQRSVTFCFSDPLVACWFKLIT